MALGRRLFQERRLSRTTSMSCATCHDPRRAFTDGRQAARGVDGLVGTLTCPRSSMRRGRRVSSGDGRAATLEEQALQPVLNPRELGMTPDRVLALVRSPAYRAAFVVAFASEPTLFDVGRALASYVRTIEAGDAPYDRYVAGDERALHAAAQRGLVLFNGKARCNSCHVGALLTDGQFHNTGVAWRRGELTDEGRSRVTHRPVDRGAFKTPTLREVARTAPYMHDGSLSTLQAVVEFYDRGGGGNPGLDGRIRPLHLSVVEKSALVALLQSRPDPFARVSCRKLCGFRPSRRPPQPVHQSQPRDQLVPSGKSMAHHLFQQKQPSWKASDAEVRPSSHRIGRRLVFHCEDGSPLPASWRRAKSV